MTNDSSQSPLAQLQALNPHNESARKLRLIAIDIIQFKQKIPLRGNKINLAWLAGTVGLTRQVFYPGRGVAEFSIIAEILLKHALAQPGAASLNSPYDKTLAALRTEIAIQRDNVAQLERELIRSKFWDQALVSGKILTF
jgi:hypothetical protein